MEMEIFTMVRIKHTNNIFFFFCFLCCGSTLHSFDQSLNAQGADWNNVQSPLTYQNNSFNNQFPEPTSIPNNSQQSSFGEGGWKKRLQIIAAGTILVVAAGFTAYYAQQLIKSKSGEKPHTQTDDTNCAICFENEGVNYTLHTAQQNNGSGVIHHRFHQGCILNWAHKYKEKHPNSYFFPCPLCNQHVPYPT
jgi:hypothetical protein